MVIELFPEGKYQYDYQMLAEALGLNYFGISGHNVYRPFSRVEKQFFSFG